MKHMTNTLNTCSEFSSHIVFYLINFLSLCRYAITVWYFDADERAKAKEKYLTGKLIVSVEHKIQI